MAFFNKKNKKEKKGFFSRRKHELEEEKEELSEDIAEEEPVPSGDIEEAISEREQAVLEEELRRRTEAEEAAKKEREAAIALAEEAAQLAALTQDVEEMKEISEEPEEKEEEEEILEAETVSVEVSEQPEEEIRSERKSIFSKIREGLRKTKESMMLRIQNVLSSFTKIDEDLFDELLETMIMGDMGVETSEAICNALRKRIKERGITDPGEIMSLIQEIISEMLGEDKSLELTTKPSVIMVIGVNGAGKTTTIGKLCHQLKADGKKVIVAAADTFRAAAIDQLEVWTQRSGVELVKHAEGSDPGAVVYDAIDAAKARGCDVLICDTAGRLHNKKNLMQELAKINRIISTRAEGCAVETLLVLDATTGQNAVNQARLFKETADISGIVLTKLDGTAKGGIIVSIKNELDIPVKLIGVGEKIDDLQPFCAEDFVNALFEKEER